MSEQRSAIEAYNHKVADLKDLAFIGHEIDGKLTKDERAIKALEIADRLQEPNLLAIYRLIQIFGWALIEQKADDAFELYQQGQIQLADKKKFAKSDEATAIATTKGQPRTCGGVFFFLMNHHCDSLNISLAGLHLPELPAWYNHGGISQNQKKQVKPLKATSTERKPTRAILKLVGHLEEKPEKLKKYAGLVQLQFQAEMYQGLSKEFKPLMGNKRLTSVLVWCTEKQYNKIKPVSFKNKFIIEGEAFVSVLSPSGEGEGEGETKPKGVLRVFCTKLTTLEYEQAQQQQLIQKTENQAD